MKAIIFGAPGSGKGTYAARLKEKLDINIISMGDIFREMLQEDSILGRIIKSYVEAGLLVPDIIALEVLKDRIAKIPNGNGFILDGYPRTLAQADSLSDIAEIDVIIQLIVPDWLIIERLTSRRICKKCGAVYNLKFLKPKTEGVCDKCGGSLYQRPDDNAQVIKMRLDIYECETSPLIRYYKNRKVPFIVHTASTTQTPPESVVDKFIAELKNYNLV
ncbi:MAG: nucleoside monophosphate kinase [Candidatus Bathyarchaeota archaeon]|nr:nucleoside monophosphate kinase [Candidatus Bathyarchaeota archaeon]